MSIEQNMQQLVDAGVSVWLDDLSRERIEQGSLRSLTETHGVVGVTTNPAIFARAIGDGSNYSAEIERCAAAALSPQETIRHLVCRDVADACDVLAEVARNSNGRDGWVSVEVSPEYAYDAAATAREARELAAAVDRSQVMVKIPATAESLPAITETIAAGISVNVTLIFSVTRYREVLNAYLLGLELARAAGRDISQIHSVASVFVSRFDTALDDQFLADSDPEIRDLAGRVGIANALLCSEIFEQTQRSERAQQLLAAGAQPQRLLWASTGVKTPRIPDTAYVSELVVANTVNTMPESTLRAFADHGGVPSPEQRMSMTEANRILNTAQLSGVNYAELTAQLEREGVSAFVSAWKTLQLQITQALEAAQHTVSSRSE